jgi:hypothetical protein
MRELNRLKLEQLVSRYTGRREHADGAEQELFVQRFEQLVTQTLRPVLEEVAAALRQAGHEPQIIHQPDPRRPKLELALGIRGAQARRNVVGFTVIQRDGHPLEVQSYVEVTPPQFDLDRFTDSCQLTAEVAERIVLEGLEHVLSCNAC